MAFSNDSCSIGFPDDIGTAPIFRVPSPLRNIAEDMFTPQIVSIGPLHNPHLIGSFHESCRRDSSPDYSDMEPYKRLAVQRLGQDVEFSELVEFLKEQEKTVRSYYEGGLESHEHAATETFSKDLATIVATDAFFVTCILQGFFEENRENLAEKFSPQERTELDNIENGRPKGRFQSIYNYKLSRPVRKAVLQDLLLVENQIPLFVLEKVISMDKSLNTNDSSTAGKLLELYLAALAHRILPFNRSRRHVLRAAKHQSKTSKHLLDSMYSIVCSRDTLKSQVDAALDAYPEPLPCANKLVLSGVKLHGHGGGLTEISFNKGTLSIPKIRVDDDTERIFRNLIAYESSCKVDNVDVLSYLHFMDFLIDTQEDVSELTESKIITEAAGSDERVAQMWNRLCRNTVCVYSANYKEAAEKATKYCDSRVNTMWAEFYRLFLSRPWLPASVISAALLLIMTLVIMYYTILVYRKDE